MAVEEVGLRLTLQQRRETARGLAEVESGLGDVAAAGKDVSAAGDQAARSLERASDKRFSRGFLAIGRGVAGVTKGLGRGLYAAGRTGAVGLGVASVAAAGLSVKAIGLASDARETASAFDTVFGPSARGVGKEIDGLSNRFGLYAPELQDAARQLGVFGKAAGVAGKDLPGFSTDLVRAGLDLSSFYNVDPSEAFGALQSGLAGEAEPLRRFGIFISDASLKAQAASQGLTGELTEQQKVMLRQKIIMKGLGDAQGDLARTADGFANQQRGAVGRSKELLSMLGGPLTTAATGAFRGLNTVLRAVLKEVGAEMPGLEKGARGLSNTFERWGKGAAKEVPGILDRVASAGDRASAFFAKARGFVDGIDWGNTSAGLSAISTSLQGADWGAVQEGLGPAVSDSVSVFGTVIGFAADHVDTLGQYLPLLTGAFIAYKGAQALANVAAIAAVPVQLAQVGSTIALASSNRALATQLAIVTGTERVSTASRVASTVATSANAVATGVASAATKVWAAGQWLLNAALTANPIGLVVAAIALLVGGIVLAYQKSETFRGIVNGLWNNVLKPFGNFIGQVFVGYIRILATAWLTMGIFGVRAFRFLLNAAFAAFDGILSAAEKGLGWIPGVGDKIAGARAAFNGFRESVVGSLNAVEDKLVRARDLANDLGRDRSSTISVNVDYNVTGPAAGQQNRVLQEGGATMRERGGPVLRGRPYIVGEKRPELFVPDQDGQILPRVPSMASIPASDLGRMADDLAMSDLTAELGDLPPIHVTSVIELDGKVVAESTVKHLGKKVARS